MTDTPLTPDGWYPDPAGGGGLRRWNGSAWTDEVRPPAEAPAAEPSAAEPSAAEAPVAPEAPSTTGAEPVAPPVAPAAEPSAPPVASAPESVASPVAPAAEPVVPPVAPAGAPAYPAAPAAPAYSGAPAYPGAPQAAPAAAAPARRDIPTNTVWIWLVVALPLVSLLTLFLFDWSTFIQESIYASAFPEQAPYAASSSFLVTAGTSEFGFVLAGLTVLFSFLDWRQLRARGIQKPFHWAWSLFVLAISSGGVYIIGRAVILRRQTGKGLAPVWGWIAVTVISIVAVSIWFFVIFSQVFAIIEQLQYYGY